MACKPVPVKISQEEWRRMYEDECAVRYSTAALGPDGVLRYTRETIVRIDGADLEIDRALETARPSEVIRDLCRKSYEDWAAMRWGNFRAAVAAIHGVPEIRTVIDRTVDELTELATSHEVRKSMKQHPPRKHHRAGVVVDVSHWQEAKK